jgi:serine/threonine protein kinase
VSTTAYEPGARDRYTLSRLHATGGIGRVWLAHDAGLGRDIALKELRPERADNPAVWARFVKEAQVTGQLEHPGIVPIYELGRRPEDQQPFYTMRFVRGRTLAEATAAYHKRRASGEAGPLELRELLTAFVGVCNAVAYAHSRGVLHRDLKPQNVVLGDYGEVVVLDWGLARLVGQAEGEAVPLEVSAEGEADATVQGQVLGTPAYMAPEQAEGRLDLLGPTTDVYGLGAILYEILAGQPPFAGPETTAVLRLVIHEAPLRPGAGAPAALEAVCLKALAKQPAERYDTAKDLAGEVQRWLADEPVSAYRDPLPVRLTRWARKHRTAVAVGAAVLQTVVVVLTVSVLLIARSRSQIERERAQVDRERAQAERERRRAEAVNAFLVKDLLAQASPEENPAGEKLTVRELLDRAAGAIGTSSSIRENPEVEGAVRAAIGSTYCGLGLWGRAREELERAVACQDQAPDVPVAERIFTKNRLCWVTFKLGSFDETMVRQVLAQARAELGPDHQETVYAADTLAMIAIANHKGRPGGRGEPFDLYRENLATQRRVLGPEHPLTVRAAVKLAEALSDFIKSPETLEESAAVLHTTRDAARRLGPDHPEALRFGHILGRLYARQGKFAEAKEVFAPLQEHYLKVYGADHLIVTYYHEDWAETEEALGHLGAAEALLLKAHAVRKSRLGDGHALTRRAAAQLGRVCMGKGKTEEAVAWLRVLLTAGVVRRGPGINLPAPNPAPEPRRLTDTERQMASFQEQHHGGKPPPPGDINRLGDALSGKADPITSVELLRELHATLGWLTGSSDWLTAHVRSLLTEAQWRRPGMLNDDASRATSDAIWWAKEVIKDMEANPATPPRFLDEARARLKRLMEADANRGPAR